MQPLFDFRHLRLPCEERHKMPRGIQTHKLEQTVNAMAKHQWHGKRQMAWQKMKSDKKKPTDVLHSRYTIANGIV